MIPESEFALLVVDNHFKLLSSISDSGMLWWISGTIMCIGILKTAIEYKNKYKNKIPLEIVTFITLFLGSIVFFGMTMCYSVMQLEKEFNSIVGPILEYKYSTEAMYDFVIFGIFIGSTSFFLFFCSWIYIIFFKETKIDKKEIKEVEKK